MTMRMKYPYISGNDICDGTVHLIEPIKLNRIVGLPLLLFDYYDYDYGTNCVTVILVDELGFHKAPLLEYGELFETLELAECLESIDIKILPDMIEANRPALDWPDLVATCPSYLSSPDSPPQFGFPIGADLFNPSPDLCRSRPRGIITLYINGKTVMYRHSDTFQMISYDSLRRFFDEYDIIWRYTDGTLVKDRSEINANLRACERSLSNNILLYQIVDVGLTGYDSTILPPYYGCHIHRYNVNVMVR